jgi:hypothetical protein
LPSCYVRLHNKANYVLKGGELFNMVLLVPDDMPLDGANTLAGDVDEMRALYKDWGKWTLSGRYRACD